MACLAGPAVPPLLAQDAEEPSDSDPEVHLEELEVIGVTPIPGLGEPIERVPSNVQHVTEKDLDEAGTADVTGALSRRVGGIHVGQTQNNPFQPDLTYRGFVSSFLLGSPQGISVFQDGVRVNEFLGDVVNWDLIPEDAIASVAVAPGADPIYGRNTLGSAIALQTKRGRTHPGTRAEAYGGSFGRRRFALETGGAHGSVDYFLHGNVVREDGFRDFSDSEMNQFFGRAGWRGTESEIGVSYTFSRNELRGNGFAPESFLDLDRSAVFTHPDIVEPDLHFLTLAANRAFGPEWRADLNLYYRNLDLAQFNADDASEEEEDEEETSDEPLPGVNRDSRIEQTRFGGGVQVSYLHFPFLRQNSLTLGADFDLGSAEFALAEQPGFVNERRTVVGTGAFEPVTDVDTDGDAIGVFLTDTFTPWPWISVTASSRYDRTHLEIDDRLEGDASGDHTFDRLNPAFGLTFRPLAKLHFFGRLSRSFRAPTAIELTCASETDPCPLPIAFAEDPPLDEVRATGYEVGARIVRVAGIDGSIALFRTELEDDILFVSRERAAGFFRNVGETRRQGVEAFFEGPLGPSAWFVSYSFTAATFETAESLPSPAGDNSVRPGDELPGVPNHLVKAGVAAPLFRGFRVSLDTAYTGEQFLRTDEANQRAPLDDYVIVNAGLSYTHGPLTLFARAENLFDAEYETFGSQGENPFAGGRVERFLSPGAPLGGWVGVRVELTKPSGEAPS